MLFFNLAQGQRPTLCAGICRGPFCCCQGRSDLASFAAVGITMQQLAALQSRLERAKRKPAAGPALEPLERSARKRQVILGIDPSLRGTGYGIVRELKSGPQAVAHGTVRCPKIWPRSRCLARIATTIREVIRRYQPEVCVVEGLFYAQNLQTAMVMGEARGASLAMAAEAGLDIFELAPRKVKQAIVGYGAAQKDAVARMVQRLLGLAETPEPDAADALALALAYAQETARYSHQQPKKV